MHICTKCGEQNADGARLCTKCGIALGPQLRAIQDVKKGQSAGAIRIVMWVVGLVILVVVGPPLYHAGGVALLNFQLRTATERDMKDCGGPITDSMQQGQKDTINKCLAENSELIKIKANLDNFTKGDK